MTSNNHPSHSPPLSPLSSGPGPLQTAPTLLHSIIPAAHCLAPLDDLHLAHLINELKPPPPVWSFCDSHQSHLSSSTPSIQPNDRLRTDELADLPAPEAERLHAAYDIEDHLDCTPDRLLVYGPSTPLVKVLKDVKDLLLSSSSTSLHPTKNSLNQANFLKLNDLHSLHHPHHFDPTPSHRPTPQVYVARLWFQPIDGPDGSYKWTTGGSDLIKFELSQDCPPSEDDPQPVLINWSSVEVALSQALEVGHQLLALLHSRQFKEILASIDHLSEFRPINPIVWLVDPVEYAHAQLRETTEWGWSEHHVELNPSNSSHRSYSSYPHSNSSTISNNREPNRPLSRSQLRQDLCSFNEDQLGFSPDSIPHGSSLLDPHFFNGQFKLMTKNQADDLPNWLDDLLDRRLPRLLSLPGGCLSYELLNSSHPSSSSNQHIPCNVAPKLPTLSLASPPERSDDFTDDGASSTTSKMINMSHNYQHKCTTTLSAFGSPTRPFGFDQRSLANSVPSFDQHYIPSPGNATRRHGQTNTLRYYPCKACAEHAFKLALSHKLDEERRRLPRTISTRANKSSTHSTHKRGSKGGSTSDLNLIEGSFGVGCPSKFPSSSIHSLDCLPSFSTSIDGHLSPSSSAALGGLITTNQIEKNSNQHFSHHSNGNSPVIGLSPKGKALKEAMDKEDDEFLKTQRLLSSKFELNSQHLSIPSSQHTWDEGEAVED